MTTLTWNWNLRPATGLVTKRGNARAYLKALRAAEQAAWERYLPAVEKARWEEGGERRRPGIVLLLPLLVAAGTAWVLSSESLVGAAAVLDTCLSWGQALLN